MYFKKKLESTNATSPRLDCRHLNAPSSLKNVSRLLYSQTSLPRSSPTHRRQSLAATVPDSGGFAIDDAPGTQPLVKNSLTACALLQFVLSTSPFFTSTECRERMD